MKKFPRILIACVILISVMVAPVGLTVLTSSVTAHALQYRDNILLHVDDNTPVNVRVLHQSYMDNRYLSLRDIAAALKGTSKAFSASIGSKDGATCIFIKTGENYSLKGGENTPFSSEQLSSANKSVNLSRKKVCFDIDGEDRFYYAMFPTNSADIEDCFLGSGDMSVLLDLDMSILEDELYINTSGDFIMDFENMIDSGFAMVSDSCIVGDVTTGEVYFAHNPDTAVAIASTTKLMTYLLIMDGVSNGEISLDDTVTFSENAASLSRTEDGVISIHAGQKAPIYEVIEGMLIKSSNECALGLAEHLCGTEEDFVKRMRAKALELGMSDSVMFNNCNGLPVYSEMVMSAKLQNMMSANDMFILVSAIMKNYPQITDITSIVETHLPSLNVKVKNTNQLLKNIPEVVGLKTGTTTKAGSCLVALAVATDDLGNTHYIVSAEFGAEDSQTQAYLSSALIRYGQQVFSEKKGSSAPTVPDEPLIPDNPRDLYRRVMAVAPSFDNR